MRDFRRLLLLPIAVLALSCGGGAGSGPGSIVLHRAETVVATAAFPTALRFTPDGDLIYVEKATGNVRKISNGSLDPQPIFSVPVNSGGERGLLGLAIDPNYSANRFVYIFYTKSGGTEAEILRFTNSGAGPNPTPIVQGLPAANIHNGGRIAFGPDGKLYATVGDVGSPGNSQSDGVLAGKTLRYNADGTIPADNPIPGNPLFSKGLRNSFGLAIDSSGTVFVSENGPNCDDEINRLTPGGNFGWRPGQPCGDTDPAYQAPLFRFASVIAPTGIAIGTGRYAGSLLVASFNHGRVQAMTLDAFPNGSVTNAVDLIVLNGEAVIDVTIGPDGNPYLATDSRIVRLVP